MRKELVPNKKLAQFINYNCYLQKKLNFFYLRLVLLLRTDRTQLDNVDCGAKDSLLQDFGRHQLKCAKGSIYAATNLFQRTCSSKKCQYTRKKMKLVFAVLPGEHPLKHSLKPGPFFPHFALNSVFPRRWLEFFSLQISYHLMPRHDEKEMTCLSRDSNPRQKSCTMTRDFEGHSTD